MRQIKFRAWDTKDRKWCNSGNLQLEIGGLGGLYWQFGSDTEPIGMPGKEFELMQLTGLTDKNGINIYEGDIVQGGFDDYRGVITFGQYANPGDGDQWTAYPCFYIKWDKEHAQHIRGDMGYWLTNGMETATIVIGNIYENSELLK